MSAILLTPDMEDAQDRILCRVNIVEGCHWKWNGAGNHAGYGALTFRGKAYSAHRLSYQAFNGPIPVGMHILHTCDNPWCVNPAHLQAGTAKENRADCKAKGRLNIMRGSANGFSKLTEDDVLEIRTSDIGPRELAKKFGLHEGSICHIRRGLTWKHIPGIRNERGQARGSASVKAKITESDVVEIRASNNKIAHLAKRFGVSPANISMIKLRKSWKHIPDSTEIGA